MSTHDPASGDVTTIRHHTEECGCTQCGCPLYVGDSVFWYDGDAFCSNGCIRAFDEPIGNAWAFGRYAR